jgi:glutamine synthetase
MSQVMKDFLRDRNIHEVECVIADMTGIARGKILPKDLFLSERRDAPAQERAAQYRQRRTAEQRALCRRDRSRHDLRAGSGHDARRALGHRAGRAGDPRLPELRRHARSACRRARCCARCCGCTRSRLAAGGGAGDGVLSGRAQQQSARAAGARRLAAAARRSRAGSRIRSTPSTISIPSSSSCPTFCKQHELGVETLIHEAGAGQMEINFTHGEALELADRVFLFKRAVRETALRHGIFATFMAKPMETEPGSAMHIHQSVLDTTTGYNIFSRADGDASDLFFNYIAGLEKYVPAATLLLRAACEFIPPAVALPCRRRPMCTGAMTTAPAASAFRIRRRSTAGSKTACRAWTSIPIWRWRRRWPAATSA